jgi:4-azaleucine resistance transporter AzlC
MQTFKKGFFASFPIILGYFPVAIAFGVSARGVGLSVVESVMISVLVFAGASQFALVSLLAAGTSAAMAAVASLMLNLRHLLYGLLLAPVLRRVKLSAAAPLAFGLTDEVFATAISQLERIPEEKRTLWLLGLEAGAYLSWVFGTLLGAAGTSILLAISPAFAPTLSFALPALFLVLLLPLLKGDAIVAALTGGLVALAFHLIGLTAFGILVAGILGPLVGFAFRRR